MVGVCANEQPAPPVASRLRVLSLGKVVFSPGSSRDVTSFFFGQQAAAMPDAAVAAYFFDVERACPALEVFETSRAVEYISAKDARSRGMRAQPNPVLRNLAGLRLARLRTFSLDGVDFDAASFAGVEFPALERVTLAKSNLSGADGVPALQTRRNGVVRPLQQGADVNDGVSGPTSSNVRVRFDLLKPW